MSKQLRMEIAEYNAEIFSLGAAHLEPAANEAFNADVRRAMAGTRTWTPAQLAALPQAPAAGVRANVSIANEPSLAAARRLDDGNLAVMNFASGRYAGGGYLRGARAQEECLCRESALHPALETQFDSYYAANRAHPDALFTHHMIHSPKVPVFRAPDYSFLDTPFNVSFVTVPAASRRRLQSDRVWRVEETMRERLDLFFRLCQHAGHKRIVVGAWGCGAYANEPEMVSGLFREALFSNGWARAFELVHFAVLDVNGEMGVFEPFERALAA